MKAIFGVLFGYALMFVIVGTALAEGSPRATANATSRSQGSADIQDGKALQGQTAWSYVNDNVQQQVTSYAAKQGFKVSK